MKKRLFLLITMLLILPLLVVACGDDEDDDGDDNGGDNGAELSGTYDAEVDGFVYRIQHPAGWVGNQENGVVLASSQAVIDAAGQEGATLSEGQHAIILFAFPKEAGMAMDDIVGMMTSEDENTEVSEVETVSVNGKDARRVSMSSPEASGWVYVIEYDAAYVVASSVTQAGQGGSIADLTSDMLNTLEVTAVEPPAE